jgi:hypothetical protein
MDGEKKAENINALKESRSLETSASKGERAQKLGGKRSTF